MKALSRNITLLGCHGRKCRYSYLKKALILSRHGGNQLRSRPRCSYDGGDRGGKKQRRIHPLREKEESGERKRRQKWDFFLFSFYSSAFSIFGKSLQTAAPTVITEIPLSPPPLLCAHRE